jgi:hypothetical protein
MRAPRVINITQWHQWFEAFESLRRGGNTTVSSKIVSWGIVSPHAAASLMLAYAL